MGLTKEGLGVGCRRKDSFFWGAVAVGLAVSAVLGAVVVAVRRAGARLDAAAIRPGALHATHPYP